MSYGTWTQETDPGLQKTNSVKRRDVGHPKTSPIISACKTKIQTNNFLCKHSQTSMDKQKTVPTGMGHAIPQLGKQALCFCQLCQLITQVFTLEPVSCLTEQMSENQGMKGEEERGQE